MENNSIQEILKKYKFKTQKSLGQNFLKDFAVLNKIAESADIKPNETIIEIGPGLGTLTEILCQQAQKVIAIEKDSQLIPVLKDRLSDYTNLTITNQDALKFNLSEHQLKPSNYKLVANIPYYITSPIINFFLKNQFVPSKKNIPQKTPPKTLVLLIQKEVAEKICSQPGDLSVIALNVQTFGSPTIIDYVSANAFIPPPKVESAILKIELYPEPQIPEDLINIYFQLIHAGFFQKRKTIKNSLLKSLTSVPDPKPIPKLNSDDLNQILKTADIEPTRRAETLSIKEWLNLAATVKSKLNLA